MIAQRPADAIPAVRAAAEQLPFADGSFDAAMALHTVHHWSDPAAGLGELRRVARRVVVVAGDARVLNRLWLIAEYFPGIAERCARADVQPQAIAERLGGRAEIRRLRVPVACLDGFPEAFIARPEAFLDPDVRRQHVAVPAASRRSRSRRASRGSAMTLRPASGMPAMEPSGACPTWTSGFAPSFPTPAEENGVRARR